MGQADVVCLLMGDEYTEKSLASLPRQSSKKALPVSGHEESSDGHRLRDHEGMQ